MGGVFRSVKKAVKKVVKTVTKPFKKVFKAIKKGVKKVWKGVKKVVKKVGKAFSKLGPIASIALSVFLPMAMPWLANYGVWGAMAKGAITGFVTSGGSLKGTLIGAAGGGIGYAGSKGFSAFSEGYKSGNGFTESLMKGFDAVGKTTSDGVSNMFKQANNFISNGGDWQAFSTSPDGYPAVKQQYHKDKIVNATVSGDPNAIKQASTEAYDSGYLSTDEITKTVDQGYKISGIKEPPAGSGFDLEAFNKAQKNLTAVDKTYQYTDLTGEDIFTAKPDPKFTYDITKGFAPTSPTEGYTLTGYDAMTGKVRDVAMPGVADVRPLEEGGFTFTGPGSENIITGAETPTELQAKVDNRFQPKTGVTDKLKDALKNVNLWGKEPVGGASLLQPVQSVGKGDKPEDSLDSSRYGSGELYATEAMKKYQQALLAGIAGQKQAWEQRQLT